MLKQIPFGVSLSNQEFRGRWVLVRLIFVRLIQIYENSFRDPTDSSTCEGIGCSNATKVYLRRALCRNVAEGDYELDNRLIRVSQLVDRCSENCCLSRPYSSLVNEQCSQNITNQVWFIVNRAVVPLLGVQCRVSVGVDCICSRIYLSLSFNHPF